MSPGRPIYRRSRRGLRIITDRRRLVRLRRHRARQSSAMFNHAAAGGVVKLVAHNAFYFVVVRTRKRPRNSQGSKRKKTRNVRGVDDTLRNTKRSKSSTRFTIPTDPLQAGWVVRRSATDRVRQNSCR